MKSTVTNGKNSPKDRISHPNAKVVCHYCTGMTALIVKILARVGKRVIFIYIIYNICMSRISSCLLFVALEITKWLE